MDINEVATLLHVEEKLRAHGEKYKHMLTAIRKKLDEAEEQNTPKEESSKDDKSKKDDDKAGSGKAIGSHPSSQTSSTLTDRRP